MVNVTLNWMKEFWCQRIPSTSYIKLWKTEICAKSTKWRVIASYVTTVLIYDCECWTISNEMMKRLESAEMWFLTFMLRISSVEKKLSEEVLQMANVKRNFTSKIRKHQLQSVGHILRHSELQTVIFYRFQKSYIICYK